MFILRGKVFVFTGTCSQEHAFQAVALVTNAKMDMLEFFCWSLGKVNLKEYNNLNQAIFLSSKKA